MDMEELINKIRNALDGYEKLPWDINEKQFIYTKTLMYEYLRRLEIELDED